MKLELASRQNRAFWITNRVTIELSCRSTSRKTRTLGVTERKLITDTQDERREGEKIF